MIKKIILSFVLLIVGLNTETSWAKIYEVTAQNARTRMSSNYWVDNISVDLIDNAPVVIIRTEGDCETQPVWKCDEYWHNDHPEFPVGCHDHHGHYDPYCRQGHSHEHGNQGFYRDPALRPDQHRHTDCRLVPQTTCQYQTGYYPLPADQVIFDGAKRFKFIGDGQYLTIARNNRVLRFLWRSWDLRKNTRVEPNGDFSQIKLIIDSDKR